MQQRSCMPQLRTDNSQINKYLKKKEIQCQQCLKQNEVILEFREQCGETRNTAFEKYILAFLEVYAAS